MTGYAEGNDVKNRSPAASGMSAKTLGLSLGVAAVAVLIGLGAYAYSGAFDITATHPHWELTERLLRAVKDQSISKQAAGIQAPELDDPARVHAGFQDIQAMCVACHVAPGAEASELSKGLYPQAPHLRDAAKGRTPAELYMIIRNGVKMSGMPAWGPSHSDDEIWSMVAFLNALPEMPDAQYQAAVEYLEARGVKDDHHH